jgi:hypothetical protein
MDVLSVIALKMETAPSGQIQGNGAGQSMASWRYVAVQAKSAFLAFENR